MLFSDWLRYSLSILLLIASSGWTTGRPLCVWGRVTYARYAIWSQNPHQTTKYHGNDKAKVNIISLAYCWSQFEIKRSKNPVFYGTFLAIRWINPRSAVANYRKCMRSNGVSRVRHATSNTEDGLPVVGLVKKMAAASSRFSVWEEGLDNLFVKFWTPYIYRKTRLFALDFFSVIVDSGSAFTSYHAIEISSPLSNC